MGISNKSDIGGDNKYLKSSFDSLDGNPTDVQRRLNLRLQVGPFAGVSNSDSESEDEPVEILFPDSPSPISMMTDERVLETESDSRDEDEEGSQQDHVRDGNEEVEATATVTFNPPVYIQRYCTVRDTLDSLLESPKYKDLSAGGGKTVMEVGCAEFGMLKYLKNMQDIQKIIFLDLDEDLLKDKAHVLRPFPAEYLQRSSRPKPLLVEAFAGCVTKVDAKLKKENPDIFAIVGIELIEHLHPEILRGFEQTVFGIYSPPIVIVTTPNSEFNEVFNLPSGKFRHWDHKFEWTRSEFEEWCKKIIHEFTDYAYRTEGICEGTEEYHHLGCVSQMAVFEKKNVPLDQEDQTSIPEQLEFRIQEGSYKLIQSVTYPHYVETRSMEEITLDEFSYYVNNFIMTPSAIDEFLFTEVAHLPVSLNRFTSMSTMPPAIRADESLLISVLEQAGYQIITEDEERKVVLDVQKYAALMEADVTEDEDEDVDLEVMHISEISDGQSDPLIVSVSAKEEEEAWE